MVGNAVFSGDTYTLIFDENLGPRAAFQISVQGNDEPQCKLVALRGSRRLFRIRLNAAKTVWLLLAEGHEPDETRNETRAYYDSVFGVNLATSTIGDKASPGSSTAYFWLADKKLKWGDDWVCLPNKNNVCKSDWDLPGFFADTRFGPIVQRRELALKAIHQIAKTTQALHEKGYVVRLLDVRDLIGSSDWSDVIFWNPQNFQFLQPKAVSDGPVTRTVREIGDAIYMDDPESSFFVIQAPEARRPTIDEDMKRTDVFLVASLLLQCLTGESPSAVPTYLFYTLDMDVRELLLQCLLVDQRRRMSLDKLIARLAELNRSGEEIARDSERISLPTKPGESLRSMVYATLGISIVSLLLHFTGWWLRPR